MEQAERRRTAVLNETPESSLSCKKIQPVHPKDQSWVFIGRTDAEAETPRLWPPHAKSWLIGNDPDAGKDWRQEKGTTEDEMVGWPHRLDGHGLGWTPGVGDGQGGLVCCSLLGLTYPLEKDMATHSSVSCLSNPADRGAWQATVHWVTPEWLGTQDISDLSLKTFLCGPFLKSLLSLLQYCFCFMCFGFSGPEACGISAPGPGVEPHLPHWKVTNGAPGSPQCTSLKGCILTWDPESPVLARRRPLACSCSLATLAHLLAPSHRPPRGPSHFLPQSLAQRSAVPWWEHCLVPPPTSTPISPPDLDSEMPSLNALTPGPSQILQVIDNFIPPLTSHLLHLFQLQLLVHLFVCLKSSRPQSCQLLEGMSRTIPFYPHASAEYSVLCGCPRPCWCMDGQMS